MLIDEKYGQPKEFFSLTQKETMCKGYMDDNKIDPKDVVDAREYC